MDSSFIFFVQHNIAAESKKRDIICSFILCWNQSDSKHKPFSDSMINQICKFAWWDHTCLICKFWSFPYFDDDASKWYKRRWKNSKTFILDISQRRWSVAAISFPWIVFAAVKCCETDQSSPKCSIISRNQMDLASLTPQLTLHLERRRNWSLTFCRVARLNWFCGFLKKEMELEINPKLKNSTLSIASMELRLIWNFKKKFMQRSRWFHLQNSFHLIIQKDEPNNYSNIHGQILELEENRNNFFFALFNYFVTFVFFNVIFNKFFFTIMSFAIQVWKNELNKYFSVFSQIVG